MCYLLITSKTKANVMARIILFKKSGREIQNSISNRIAGLQSRLENRNQSLETLLNDQKKLRSYLLRSSEKTNYGHGGRGQYTLVGEDDISSEEVEEIDQMLRRIFGIEQEIRRLELITHHMLPESDYDLDYDDLVSYGFDTQSV